MHMHLDFRFRSFHSGQVVVADVHKKPSESVSARMGRKRQTRPRGHTDGRTNIDKIIFFRSLKTITGLGVCVFMDIYLRPFHIALKKERETLIMHAARGSGVAIHSGRSAQDNTFDR